MAPLQTRRKMSAKPEHMLRVPTRASSTFQSLCRLRGSRHFHAYIISKLKTAITGLPISFGFFYYNERTCARSELCCIHQSANVTSKNFSPADKYFLCRPGLMPQNSGWGSIKSQMKGEARTEGLEKKVNNKLN